MSDIERICPVCGGGDCETRDTLWISCACGFIALRHAFDKLSKQRQLLEKIARVAGGKTLESVSMPRDIYEVLS